MKIEKVAIIGFVFAILIPIGLMGIGFFAVAGPMSKPITTLELFGKYEAQLPEKGREVIELLPEGICRQSIFLNSGQTLQATGKWQYYTTKVGASLYDTLSLEGIRYSLSEFGDHINPDIDQKTSSSLPIGRTLFGHIKIELYGDQGIYYRKVKK